MLKPLENLLKITDLWTYLKTQSKPIVLYGMGDGADKILNVCLKKNINVSGVFASDEFVRGQSFRGYKVKTYSDTKLEFGDIIILISFATRLDSVLQKIYNLCKCDEVYAPDVPVFGEGLFDSDYFKDNFANFNKVYNMLSDEVSHKAYYNILEYKLTGRIELLLECETTVHEAYETIIKPCTNSVYVDIGAYNGDTLKEYTLFSGNNITAYAFEPDLKNFNKLSQNAQSLGIKKIELINIAAWNKKEELLFYSRSGRNSAATTSHAGVKSKKINADCADNYISDHVDFINIDAEGSDMQAILGLEKTISSFQPTISCAVYHRNEDMFAIPLQLAKKYDHFKMYVRHFPYIPAWDTNIYIKPDKNSD